ncbi:MAG: acetyl-CoA C-acetyltransferase [Nesterenkonia sp.]|uniref:acetyl-CoA C-acetyltransferase n=1 Tax=Nesterenkonia marinintestina TaxID=2979865 RepID=UPI0021BECF63|nr:acetyl-CoA C-acetyltransferase [Nesterenkonia sp. GX14115]MDO5492123.1 acetyl-CoA C-acetyltransferase [Nesterenkonia sp.]
MAQANARDAVIVGGNRIPFAKAHTAYTDVSNQDMFTSALNGLVARFGLQEQRLGAVAGGAVQKHSKNFNLMRESVLGSPLDPHTPAYDVQMACATGMEAIGSLADKIRMGRIDSAVGGGVDTISDAPIVVTDGLRSILMEANRAKTTGARLKALAKIRPGHLAPQAPGVAEPRTGLSMGDHMAITAHAWGITRGEQDELAAASHQNLAAAYDRGFFDDLITPFRGVQRDTIMRPDTTAEKLARLKPVFGRDLGDEATMTAANSTALTDGASTVLLGSEEWADEHDLPKLANFVDYELAAVDFVDGAEGLLMAPAYAAARMLARNGLTFEDFEHFEIHEAFASTVLAQMRAWEDADFCRNKLGLDRPLGRIDPARLNVNGSSLAAGHPFAATGGRVVASLAKMLHGRPGKLGFISVCAAGGQGITAIVEGR